MKKAELLKRGLFVLTGVSLLIFFTFCGNNDKKDETDVDTLQIEDTVKKTREELIINRDTMSFANPDSITDFEAKHTPDIIFGESNDDNMIEVTVKIGINGIVHPSEEDHWVDHVTLFADGKEVAKKEAEPGPGSQEVKFLLDLSNVNELRAEIGCNLHGIWSNTVLLNKQQK